MPIDVTCPKCNLVLPAPEAFAGKKIRCADCNTVVDVPVPGALTVDLQPAPNFDRHPVRERGSGRKTIFILASGLAVLALAFVAIWLLRNRREEPRPEPPLPPVEPDGPALIPGLKLHLPFDSVEDHRTFEAVSQKLVGKFADDPEVVDGIRGKALKLSVPVRGSIGSMPFAIDLSDLRDRFAIDAETGLTICLWAISDSATSISPLFLGGDRPLERPRFYFTASKVAAGTYLHFDTADSLNASTVLSGEVGWHHFAMRRSSTGDWSVFYDGVPREMNGRPKRTGSPSFRFAKIGLGGIVAPKSKETKSTIAVDDLRVYDRELNNAEIASLAGKD